VVGLENVMRTIAVTIALWLMATVPQAVGSDELIDPAASREAVEKLAREAEPWGEEPLLPAGRSAEVPLTKADAERAAEILRQRLAAWIERERAAELRSGGLKIDDLTMPIWYRRFGRSPAGRRPLFISMHGGGGGPPQMNTSQWQNQQRLYQPADGIYLAPRAPTDTWDLWHQAHIDRFFDRLIADLVAIEGVDPDRVYLLGYSAGGDGVYQVAPRMADRFAAAAMMAGHPNETKPDGLRNLPFAIWVGGRDAAYDRNSVARSFGEALDRLAAADPGGYPHELHVVEGKGHWMDRADAAALPWMARQVRSLRPDRIVWLQDDVVHDRFYWLAVAQPQARSRLVARRDGQRVVIEEVSNQGEITIRLDDRMLDLDEEVTVVAEGRDGEAARELFRGRVPRTIATIAKTLLERSDPKGMFTAEVTVNP